MRALGARNATFDKVGETLYRLSSAPVVIEQCRRIEENRLDYQRLKDDNEAKDKQIAKLIAEMFELKKLNGITD